MTVAERLSFAVHLYVHVPFCGRRCSYCDFAIAVRSATPDRDFLAAIAAEWQGVGAGAMAPGSAVDTIYFGGGTPSRLDPASIAALITLLGADHSLTPDAEITLEANPDDVTPAAADAWRAAGVNRVSLGVQSHRPHVLEWMHRTHRVEQVAPAMAALRAAGIDNVSVDLIFALPAELQRDWSADLEETLALAPSHVSLYGLTVEPHTPLARWTERGSVIAAPDDRYADEYLLAHAVLGVAGFTFYEISNAALAGRRSRHNSAYWNGAGYLGLGPSAHSFADGVRRWNVRDWVEYQRRAASGGILVAGEEVLDSTARRLETLYLGLRTNGGIAASLLAPDLAARWVGAGWAVVQDERLTLTVEGWLRLDALVAAARDS